jgi:predicted dehydrogenase
VDQEFIWLIIIQLSFNKLKILAKMSAKKFNVGIIGYGLSAKIFHIPFVTHVPELNLYAIVQRSPKPDNDAERDHPGVKTYRSVEDLLKDDVVDVVIVTAAPDQHFPLTKQGLEAGKHGEH